MGVGLGKDVGGCQVQEDTGEESEVEPKDLVRDGEREGDGGTSDGGEGVGDEQGERAPAVVPVQRGDGQVLKPSAKSWLSTATATTAPTAPPAWNAAPMAKPSITLCPTRADAAKMPTPGA
jgi:hypothetical protein